MKCTSFSALAAIAAVAAALGGAAGAQSESQSSPSETGSPPSSPPVKPARPAEAARGGSGNADGTASAVDAPKPWISNRFAAGSAGNAVRLSPVAREERRFIQDAAASSRYAVDASRLALARSTDAQVRSFATTLINYHAIVGNELLRLLHLRGMAAPMLPNDQRKTLARLSKLSGSNFDRAYLEEIGLKEHRRDVLYYEKSAERVEDPTLKAWIGKTLPAVRQHLAAAERVAQREHRAAKAGAILGAKAGTPPAAPVKPVTPLSQGR